MIKEIKKGRPASKPNLSFEYAEDKLGIFAIMHPRQSSMHFSSSSSTESIKRVGSCRRIGFLDLRKKQGKFEEGLKIEKKIGKSLRVQSIGIREKGEKDLKDGEEGKLNQLGQNEDSDETVIKNFIELKNEKSKEFKGKNTDELSLSMVEIMKGLDQFEQTKEVKKWQTRLQVLQVYKLNSMRNVQLSLSRSFNRNF
jgi:hypothetical protein